MGCVGSIQQLSWIVRIKQCLTTAVSTDTQRWISGFAIFTVVDDQDTTIGEYCRRTTFSQVAIELSLSPIERDPQFSSRIFQRLPINQIRRSGKMHVSFAPVHPIFSVYGYGRKPIVHHLANNRCRLARHRRVFSC